MTASPTLRDRARGALVGAVIGDAFGSPLEGASPANLMPTLRRRAESPTAWGYTDDAMMLIAVGESIRDAGTVEPQAMLRALSARYEPARGFGRGMKIALRAFNEGTPWHQVAAAAWPEGSRGNGGAVRVAAVAIRAWSSAKDLLAAATASCRVTHAHPEAVAGAALHASLVDLALRRPEMLARADGALEALAAALQHDAVAAELLGKVRSVTTDDPAADIARACGTSPFARESVPAALASFFRCHGSFADAIVHAAALGGDVDSICAMVGAITGALLGFGAIPEAWIAAIQHESPTVTELCELADAIASLSPIPFAADAV